MEYVKEVLRRQKEFIPMLVGITRQGLVLIPVDECQDAREARVIGNKALKAINAIGYVWMMEAHAATSLPGEPIVPASKHPTRRDSLVVLGQIGDEHGMLIQYFIRENDQITFQETRYETGPMGGIMRLTLPKR